jgi:hypothetical protein
MRGFGTNTDVTEQRQKERSLSESEQRLAGQNACVAETTTDNARSSGPAVGIQVRREEGHNSLTSVYDTYTEGLPRRTRPMPPLLEALA